MKTLKISPKTALNLAQKDFNENHPIIVREDKNLAVRMARCCGPIPGDAIVGYLRKGKRSNGSYVKLCEGQSRRDV